MNDFYEMTFNENSENRKIVMSYGNDKFSVSEIIEGPLGPVVNTLTVPKRAFDAFLFSSGLDNKEQLLDAHMKICGIKTLV